MKYLICSDIHGSLKSCKKILTAFKSHNCNKIIILGDILYHGPRNPIPEEYNPKQVAIELNNFADRILSCRGNCDAEVDQMVLNFNNREDYIKIDDSKFTLFCTHGHIYAPALNNGDNPPGCESAKTIIVKTDTFYFYGHTHITVLEKNQNGNIICNPGSPTLPKDNKHGCYAIFENGKVSVYNWNDEIIGELQ